MALNPSNNSSLEQLALKGLIYKAGVSHQNSIVLMRNNGSASLPGNYYQRVL